MGKYEVISSNSRKLKRVVIAVVSFILIIVSSGIGIYYFLSLEEESKLISESIVKKNTNSVDSDKKNKIVSISDVVEESDIAKTGIKKLVVDIKGQIKNPGTYEVNQGTRVIDVIKIAGGLTAFSDTSLINLSKKVFDEMVIIVHSKDDVIKINSNKTEPPAKIENNASIDNSASSVSKVVNINTASLTELTTLSGIGDSKAQDIIDYRNSNGDFKTIDEIMNVTGIGESLFAKIKENITV